MANYIQGERFFIPLDEGGEEADQPQGSKQEGREDGLPGGDAASTAESNSGATDGFGLLVADVLERKTGRNSAPPAPPSMTPGKSRTGFPQHRKFGAAGRASRFKAQQAQPAATPTIPSTSSKETPSKQTTKQAEYDSIDRENRMRLSTMSAAEISEARSEIMAALGPEMVERIMKRKTPLLGRPEEPPQDERHAPSSVTAGQPAPVSQPPPAPTVEEPVQPPRPAKAVSFDVPESKDDAQEEANPLPRSSFDSLPSIHFPRSEAPPKLDPSSPHFLADLQSHYFPQISHDPAKLEWMSYVEPPSKDSIPTSVAVSSLRFDLAGKILAPSVQEKLPVDLGLHHHGDEPGKAGYTVAELAHLAMSLYPPQRCIAILTLGRILWRLGTGEFGKLEKAKAGEQDRPDGSEEPDHLQQELSRLAKSLASHMEQARVVDILLEEVRLEGRGHASARSYAEEAVWLWTRAGSPAWAGESNESEAMGILAGQPPSA